MQEVYRVLAKLVNSDLTVMIRGESGTGKELIAKALHDYSSRKNEPFIAINMAAIPRELIESELFGYERGAFTGAEKSIKENLSLQMKEHYFSMKLETCQLKLKQDS